LSHSDPPASPNRPRPPSLPTPPTSPTTPSVGHVGHDVGACSGAGHDPAPSGPLALTAAERRNAPNHIGDHGDELGYDAPSGLTPKQDQAIIALLNEPTIAKAATALGVSERTLHRWLEDETFHRAFRKARREAFAQAIAVTQRYAPMAVHTLAKVMTDTSVQASARVSAATNLLRFGREALELDDLAGRLEALERDSKPKDDWRR
jgi:hypothetical protein